MADVFRDNFNRPISYVSHRQEESSESDVILVNVPCVAGSSLVSDVDPYVRITARLNGSLDPFVDLATSPIDLTPYDGTIQLFDFIIETDSIGQALVSRAIEVRRTFNP